MPDVVFSVDQARSMADQAVPGHNRWHPDIPPAVRVRPGQDIDIKPSDAGPIKADRGSCAVSW
jgi:formamidase